MNGYELSRNFWNWAFDNPEIVSPNHAAIYFFAVEHCNRLGGKEKFGFPSQMTMDAVGIKKHQTYIKYFNELVEYGFFKLIRKSKNQYSSNIISLTSATPKKGKALDKAFIRHGQSTGQSTGQSMDSIDKQETINKETNIPFLEFWNMYDKKVGSKEKCQKKWNALKDEERTKIINTLPLFIKNITEKKFQPFPETYLNQKRWNDEIKEEDLKPKYNPAKPQLTKRVFN